VTTRNDRQRILRDLQALLEDEKKRLSEDEARAEKTRSEVDNLEGVVGVLAKRLGQQVEAAAERPPALGSQPTPSISIRHGQVTFTTVVRQIMADGVERSAKDIYEALRDRDALPAGTTAQQKQKIANRLVELRDQKYLERPGRGVYQLASREASQNGAEPEGSDVGRSDAEQSQPQKGMTAAETAGSLVAGVATGAVLAHAVRTIGAVGG
jgi:hypothetical protein